jgi:hypothetical protein
MVVTLERQLNKMKQNVIMQNEYIKHALTGINPE